MGRVGFGDFDNYKNEGSSASFFRLKKDKEVAQVRFMYNDIDDVEGVAVHTVDVEGAKYGRDVNCLRAYNEPIDECPLCKAGYKTKVKIFVPLYNVDADEVQIWTRSKNYGATLSGLCSRYAKNRNLVNNIFEIERNGAEGDKQTTYQAYQIDADDTEIPDLPDAPDPIGTVVMDKSFEELEYYAEHKAFPNNSSKSNDEAPRRRTRTEREDDGEDVDEAPRRRTRRTPANAEDTF
jgi:hypothetical protein